MVARISKVGGLIKVFAILFEYLSNTLVSNGDFEELGPELVDNGSFDELSSELITNGDFENGDTDWVLDSSWSVSDKKATYDASLNGQEIRQLTSSIAVGKTVKIQFDILNVEATKDAYLKLDCSGTPESVFPYTKFSEGTYTYYHPITSGFDRVNFTALNSSTGGTFSIDNISIKEATPNWQNPTYVGDNSATLSVYNGSLKVEKNADLDWRSSFVNQTPLTFIDGKTYEITYSLKDGNTGGADVYIRTNFDRSASTVNTKALTNDWVEYTDYYVADSSAEDISFGVLDWLNTGSGQYYFIDNVSVKQVDPNDDWKLNNTVWKIGDGVATADGTLNGNLQQIGVVSSGTSGTYKLEWTQEITSGTRFRILERNGNDTASAGVTFVSGSTTGGGSFISGNCVGSGTFTVYVETTDGFTLWFVGEAGNTGTVDNVSVVEVIEDDYNTDTTYILPLNMSVKFKAGDTIIGEEFLEKGIRIPVENVQDDTGATVGDEAAIASYIDSLT